MALYLLKIYKYSFTVSLLLQVFFRSVIPLDTMYGVYYQALKDHFSCLFPESLFKGTCFQRILIITHLLLNLETLCLLGQCYVDSLVFDTLDY